LGCKGDVIESSDQIGVGLRKLFGEIVDIFYCQVGVGIITAVICGVCRVGNRHSFPRFRPRNLIELFLAPCTSHSQTALGPGVTKPPASDGDVGISKFGAVAARSHSTPLNASSALARVILAQACILSVHLRYSQNRAIFSHWLTSTRSHCAVHIRSEPHPQFHLLPPPLSNFTDRSCSTTAPRTPSTCANGISGPYWAVRSDPELLIIFHCLLSSS
jgi:hypothetical protein